MEIGKKSLLTFMGLSFVAGAYMALTHGNPLLATQEVAASAVEVEFLEEEVEVLESFRPLWERNSEDGLPPMRKFSLEDGDEVRFGIPVSDIDLVERELDGSRLFVSEDYQDLSGEELRLILNEFFVRPEREIELIARH